MNRRQIDEVRDGARAKLRQIRKENKTSNSDSMVMVVEKQDCIPRG